MNSSRGIFEPQEGFAPAPPTKNPFSVADDGPSASPFAIVSEPESPFAAMKDEPATRLSSDPGRPVKLPERRPAAGDLPSAEARSPFATETGSPSPFEASSAASSPFAGSPPPVPAATTPSAPFGFDAEPVVEAKPAAAVVATPVTPAPAPASAPVLAAAAPVSAAAPAVADDSESDSGNIRQLVLRAIFGVDRELGSEEILQRARGLSGIRHVARIPASEVATLDAFKKIIAGLGFSTGQVKLVSGSVPIEFIREGNVVLAVQNDGSFAPGVKETLIIIARELGKL